MNRSHRTSPLRRWLIPTAGLVGLLLLAAHFAADYAAQFSRLEESASRWNALTRDFLTVAAAGAAAGTGALLTRQFGAGERPRSVWLWFTAGWWAWFAGEISGSGYRLLNAQVYPDIALYDIFWIIGYFCFGLSLYYQFRLIYAAGKRPRTPLYFLLLSAVLLITGGLTWWAVDAGLGEGKTLVAVYLAVFYPVCDAIEGAGAIWLSFLFGRGKWGRPWWGLIAFALADSLNTYDWLGGLASASSQTQAVLTLLADTVYLSGYLLVATALLVNYLLVGRPEPPGIAAPAGVCAQLPNE